MEVMQETKNGIKMALFFLIKREFYIMASCKLKIVAFQKNNNNFQKIK